MKIKSLIITLLIAAVIALLAWNPFSVKPAEPVQPVPAEIEETADLYSLRLIKKHGNIVLDTDPDSFLAKYAYGDILTAALNGREFDMPVCENYSQVDQGAPVCVVSDEISLAINGGDFASASGAAVKETISEDPGYKWVYAEDAEVEISLKEKGGYLDQLAIRSLVRSEVREDYPDLSDEEYANFRQVIAGRPLYRSTSPLSLDLNRAEEADEACRKYGIRTIVNLADTEEECTAYPGFHESYYASADRICLSMNYDFFSEEFSSKMADGLRFIASHEGPYLIHCKEGKDRTGFVCGILACLMGADEETVIRDYMLTFRNFYGVEEGTEKYDLIADQNIRRSLKKAFETDDLGTIDLQEAAVKYLQKCGMDTAEIQALQEHLQ